MVFSSTARNDIEQVTLSITERQTPATPPGAPSNIVSPSAGTSGGEPLEGRTRMSREQALAKLELPSNATDQDIKQAMANYEKKLRSFRRSKSATPVAQASAVNSSARSEDVDLEKALQLSLTELHSVSELGRDASQYNGVPL